MMLANVRVSDEHPEPGCLPAGRRRRRCLPDVYVAFRTKKIVTEMFCAMSFYM
jgi:hypothetical protein